MAGTLDGLRVLIVEDEVLVAMTLEDVVSDLGCHVVAVVGDAADALEAAAIQPLDAAILDVNLGGERVFPVADLLADRGVPFVFSTGYGPTDLSRRYPGRPQLRKPYPPEALAEALEALIAEDQIRKPALAAISWKKAGS